MRQLGFRPRSWPDDLVARMEIAVDFGPKLSRLQWEGEGYRDGNTFKTKGIVLVPDPYKQRPRTNKKGGNAPADLQ